MFDKTRMKRNCAVGKMAAEKFEEVEVLKAKVEALETKLAAVLAATDADENKTLKIDDAGKVALVS